MMIQPVTLLGAGLFFAVLFWRYRNRPKNQPRRSFAQKLKSTKMLLVALLAWLALTYTLKHMISTMDGDPAREPSMVERIVSFFK